MILNKKQMSLVIASVLGDGYLPKKDNSILSIQHSVKQYKYLVYLRNKFIENGFEVTGIYNVSRKFEAYRFNVKLPIEDWKILRHHFYPNGNKTVTRHLLNYLDEEGLAIWFMDDGNREIHWKKDDTLSHWSLGLSTHSFTKEEHQIIKQYFKTVWNIDLSIIRDRQYYRCRFNTTNSKLLIRLIENYIEESMQYKITIPQTRQRTNGHPYGMMV